MGVQETVIVFNALGQSTTIDTSEFMACALQVSGTFVATLSFEQSNDGVNFVAADGVNAVGQVSPVNSITFAGSGIYLFPTLTRFIRFRVSAYTSGTINLDAICSNDFVSLKSIARIESYGGSASPTITQESVLTTAGGLTQFKRISTADLNNVIVKAAAGRVYGYNFQNTNVAAWRYLKLYNKATAPVVGTDVPIRVIGIPPNDKADYEAMPSGLAGFTAGISIAITAGMADADTTAIAANEVCGSLDFA